MLLSKDKSFDDTLANTFRSKYCYIYVPPNSTEANATIHISLKRLPNHLGKLEFAIVAVPEGSEVLLEFGAPYYDYLQKNASKLFTFHVDRNSIDE